MSAVVPFNQSPAVSSHNALVPTSIEQAIALAEVMSKGNLMPDHLRGKPGDCLLIVMQAQRWGMDALSVAQCTSVVHGKLCYEGKLVAAALYAMGAVEGRLHYEISGSGQGASIVVTAKPRGGTGPQSVSGSVKDWRTTGKNKEGAKIDNAWDKMPEDMLVYRGTRQWARRYAPEALLGVYTPDEMEEIDVTPQAQRPAATTGEGQPKAPPSMPTYSPEEFDAKVPAWRDLIESGKRTVDQVIGMVSSRVALSDAQLARIRKLGAKPADAAAAAAPEGTEASA